MSDRRLRVLVLDTMLGWTGKHSVSQGEIVAGLLSDAGADVRTASRRRGRLARLADLLAAPIRHRRDVDVVSLAVFSGPAFWLADLPSRVCRRLGLPIVLVLHGGNLPALASSNPNRVRRLLARSSAVVAPSPFNANALQPLCETEIEVIPNVVATDLPTDLPQRDAAAPARVLWMRSLETLYAPEVAIGAFRRLLDHEPDAKLTMAGPDTGQCIDELRALVSTLDIADRVRFTGFLDRDAKAEAFAGHSLYLNTTRIDNTPVTPLEAAGHGLPVVTTDAGGIPDLFADGETALVVPVDDETALCDAMVTVLREPATAQSLRSRARRMVEEMRPASVGPRWTALLKTVAFAGEDTDQTRSTS
ncbi:MAG: glycosyltransferase family 4 protein [Actinomycetota bacterium]